MLWHTKLNVYALLCFGLKKDTLRPKLTFFHKSEYFSKISEFSVLSKIAQSTQKQKQTCTKLFVISCGLVFCLLITNSFSEGCKFSCQITMFSFFISHFLYGRQLAEFLLFKITNLILQRRQVLCMFEQKVKFGFSEKATKFE